MIFFGFTFVVSMLAFSTMLFIQLGTVMEDYWDQFNSLISLFRALFGDIDIDEIMSNSSGYLNVLLFLIYLFVAIFIMLSMFLAILVRTTPRLPSQRSPLRGPHTHGRMLLRGWMGAPAHEITGTVAAPSRYFVIRDAPPCSRPMMEHRVPRPPRTVLT